MVRHLASLTFAALALSLPAIAAEPAKDALPDGAKARIGDSRLRNLDGYGGMHLTPDAKRIITNYSGSNTFIDIATGQPDGKAVTPRGTYSLPVGHLSTDGKVAVTSGYENLEVWDFTTGEKILSIKRTPGMATDTAAISLSADGKFVAIGGYYDEKVKDQPLSAVVWSVKDKKQVATCKVVQNANCSVALSADGTTLLTRGRQRFEPNAKPIEPADDPARKVEIWDVTNSKIKATISDVTAEHVTLSPDGKAVAISSGQGDLTIASAETGKAVHELTGRTGMGRGLYFAPDSKTVLAMYSSGGSQLWNATTGESIGFAECPVPGEYITIRSVRFTGNATAVALATTQSRTFAWEIPSGKLLSPPGGFSEKISSLCFDGDGQQILVSVGGQVKRCSWDGKESEPFRLRIPGNNQFNSRSNYYVTFTPDGKFAYLLDDGAFGIYEMPAGVQRGIVMAPWGTYGGFYLLSADGKRGGVVISPRYQKPEPYRFFLADIEKGRRLGSFAFPAGEPSEMVLSPDGSKLYFFRTVRPEKGESTMTFCAVDTATGKVLAEEKIKAGYGNQKIVPATDGKALLVITPDGKKTVCDAATLKSLRELKTVSTSGITTAPLFSPDGTAVAVATGSTYGSGPATIEVFDWASGKPKTKFTGHSQGISCMAFSKDGKSLATGSSDTTVLLWDLTKATKD